MASSAQDVEPKILEELGRGITRWAYVDFLVGEFLTWLLRADPARAYVVTQSVAATTLTDWARTIIQIQFTNDSDRELIAGLLAEVDDARSERNALIHGLWTAETPDAALVKTVRWQRAEVMKDELVTPGDLESFSEHAGELYLRLVLIGHKLGFHRLPGALKP